MLQRRRRFFFALAFLFIAPAPRWPSSFARLRALPGAFDAYLKDHFGLRHAMIGLHKDLTHPVILKVNTAALIGRDGRMFYAGNEMVRQSAGLVMRDERIAATDGLIAAMRDALKARGITFLVTVPPNASTIYQDDLPLWAQRQGRQTEYDLFLKELAARGVKTVDLRPAMTAIRAGGEAYLMHDAHWTARAALAGFNAVAEAAGHPGWRIDPATAIGPPAPRKGGDVARILGVQDDVVEMAETLTLPEVGADEAISEGPMPDHVVATGRPGPTVMVIGDSFTASYFPLMLAQHVGRAIWVHHHRCGFDWGLIDKFRPDEVWWAPTERFLLCDAGARPIGFAGATAMRASPRAD